MLSLGVLKFITCEVYFSSRFFLYSIIYISQVTEGEDGQEEEQQLDSEESEGEDY